jgi:hypothetical protein
MLWSGSLNPSDRIDADRKAGGARSGNTRNPHFAGGKAREAGAVDLAGEIDRRGLIGAVSTRDDSCPPRIASVVGRSAAQPPGVGPFTAARVYFPAAGFAGAEIL